MLYVFNLCFICRPLGFLFKVIMTTTLQELIERAYAIKIFFSIGSYELYHYEDGSYADFKVLKVVDLPTLIRLAGGLELKFFADGDRMIVRLFEKDCY